MAGGGACVAGEGAMHGGGHAWWGVCMAGGMHGRMGHAWQGACMAGACMVGGMCGRGVHGRWHAWQGGHVWHTRPQQILRDTGGTHPTGMHSCFANFWQKNCVKGEKVW